MAKSEHLQIRVTARQKAALRRLARAAGQDVSAYVLDRVLPSSVDRIADIVGALEDETTRRFALAELNDLLSSLMPAHFAEVVGAVGVRTLTPLLANYVAAMVEQAARTKRVAPPAWTRDVAPLDEPYFATPLPGLRRHLLRAAPVAFKRRNLFVDTSVGGRV